MERTEMKRELYKVGQWSINLRNRREQEIMTELEHSSIDICAIN